MQSLASKYHSPVNGTKGISVSQKNSRPGTGKIEADSAASCDCRKKEVLMKDNKEYVKLVAINLILKKWKQTILHHGMPVDKRMLKTAKCYVESVIDVNLANSKKTI